MIEVKTETKYIVNGIPYETYEKALIAELELQNRPKYYNPASDIRNAVAKELAELLCTKYSDGALVHAVGVPNGFGMDKGKHRFHFYINGKPYTVQLGLVQNRRDLFNEVDEEELVCHMESGKILVIAD